MTRRAAVVLDVVCAVNDVPALHRAIDDGKPLAREHARWALERLAGRGAGFTDPRRRSHAP